MKAIDVGKKSVAIDAGEKLVEKAAKNYPHQNHKWLISWFQPEEITKKLNEVIAKFVYTNAINFNKLIDDRASFVQLLIMQLQFKTS